MYRRFNDLINREDHEGIYIFYNADIDDNGLLTAIQDYNKNGTGDLKKMGESKSIVYLGDSDKTWANLEGIGKNMLGWKTAYKFVRYKKRSCKEVLVMGKAAGGK